MVRVLKFGHLNVRSLVAHFDELSRVVVDGKYDVFGVSETWLSEQIPNAAITIPGYNVVRRDRQTRGGGVALYLAQGLKYICERDMGIVDNDVEQVWVRLLFNSYACSFGCIYRSPASNVCAFLDNLCSTLCCLQGITDYLYCAGDLNINMLDFNSTYTERFNTLLEELSLSQMINSPTRITTNSSSLIDCLITNNPDGCINQASIPMHMSDHNLVQCDITISDSRPIPITKFCRPISNIDAYSLKGDLSRLPLYAIYHITDVNQKVHFLNTHLLALLDFHAPVRSLRLHRPFAPWLTDTIKLMMSLRDRALSRYKRTKLIAHFDYYKSLRNLTTSAIRREKKSFLNSTFVTSDVKSSWRLLSKLQIVNRSKPTVPAHLDDVGNINDYFVNSVGYADVDDDLLTFYGTNMLYPNSHERFSFGLSDTSSIIKILNGIKSTSSGIDELNITFIRMCLPEILPYIVHIINTCLEQSIFPEAWKIALVMPLPKKPNPAGLADLRPISILPVISKVLERCMEVQLRKYISDHNILPTSQSGFRPNHSCTTALLKVTDDIIRARDGGLCGILVLLDYSKAFDKVNHSMLLALLRYVGLSDSAVLLLESFLSNRAQIVKLNNVSSSSLPVRVGVPQGSILAPLLFSLYTSQLPKCIQYSSIHMYADDTQIYITFPKEHLASACSKINADLNAILDCSHKMALTLNATKSKVVIFGNLDSDSVGIFLGGERLVVYPESKNLGVLVDSNLRFSSHVTACVKKAYGVLRCLYQHRHILNIITKKRLCETLVLSNFVHCAAMYGPCLTGYELHRIQRVQNSCLRFMYGVRKRENISHTLVTAKWLNIRNKFKHQFLCLVHKLITTGTPPYLYNKITYRTDVHNLNLRHKNTIAVPAHRKALFRRSFSYNVAKEYNSCPPEFKNKSLSVFKVNLRNTLFRLQIGQHNPYAASVL